MRTRDTSMIRNMNSDMKCVFAFISIKRPSVHPVVPNYHIKYYFVWDLTWIRPRHIHPISLFLCSIYIRDVLSVDKIQIAHFNTNNSTILWKTVTIRLPDMDSGQLIFQFIKGKPHESGVALDNVEIVPCDYDIISQTPLINSTVKQGVYILIEYIKFVFQ